MARGRINEVITNTKAQVKISLVVRIKGSISISSFPNTVSDVGGLLYRVCLAVALCPSSHPLVGTIIFTIV